MKKINLLFFALMAAVLFSRNNSTGVVEEVLVEEVVEVVETPIMEISNFENADLAAFTVEFNAHFDKSMALFIAGDQEGLAALRPEGKALIAKSDDLKNSVSEADKALLEEYLKGKATEMLAVTSLDKVGEKIEKESMK